MKPAELRAAGRAPPTPAKISLDNGETLCIERWLRILPGKRLTGQGRWQERKVIAKLFVATHGCERHWSREYAGTDRLRACGLPTPALLATGRLEADGYYLIFALLEHAHAPNPEVAPELLQVFALLGRMHAQGLMHEDAHLDNFLITDAGAHVIDGDAIRASTSFADHKDNLALLFAQLTPDTEAALGTQLLHAYLSQNPKGSFDASTLVESIRKARKVRLNNYLGKTLRSCSLFRVTRTAHRFVAVVRAFEEILAPVVADPDEWLERGKPLKRGRTATLAQIDIDGLSLVIKRYNIKNATHALSRAWRPSRAWRAWIEGHRLGFLGIATPQPLALIERRFGPLRGKAWLITTHCPGMNLSEHLASSLDKPPATEIAALRKLCEQLVAAKISHGDLKATNLLWHEGGVQLIDLDAMRQHDNPHSFTRAWRKDRQRLLQNWPEGSSLHSAINAAVPA